MGNTQLITSFVKNQYDWHREPTLPILLKRNCKFQTNVFYTDFGSFHLIFDWNKPVILQTDTIPIYFYADGRWIHVASAYCPHGSNVNVQCAYPSFSDPFSEKIYSVIVLDPSEATGKKIVECVVLSHIKHLINDFEKLFPAKD